MVGDPLMALVSALFHKVPSHIGRARTYENLSAIRRIERSEQHSCVVHRSSRDLSAKASRLKSGYAARDL
jgi:hypothetical protein